MRNQKLILRKFVAAPFYRPGEFYDLSVDPGELHNLYASAAQRPAIDEMRQQLLTWGSRPGTNSRLNLLKIWFSRCKFANLQPDK